MTGDALMANLLNELSILRKRVDLAGGASATYFNGKLILIHPDIPPHIWDGKKMERLEFTPPEHFRVG